MALKRGMTLFSTQINDDKSPFHAHVAEGRDLQQPNSELGCIVNLLP